MKPTARTSTRLNAPEEEAPPPKPAKRQGRKGEREKGRKGDLVPPSFSPVKSPTAADVAIAAFDAGESIECAEGQYRRGVRQALQEHAIRLSRENKTERRRAALDEIRRFDEEFHVSE